MRSFLLFLSIFCLSTAMAANRYSRNDGLWSTGTNWSNSVNGPSCNCVPSGSDKIYINHEITLTTNITTSNSLSGEMHISQSGSLNGNGYSLNVNSSGVLSVNGNMNILNMVFNNGSTINIGATAIISILGNFENRNNSTNVNINGILNVAGAFTNGVNSGISGSGLINVSNGPASNNGQVFTNNGNPCSSFPCIISPPAPLPVELTSFTANVNNNSNIYLTWTTGSEMNSSHFEIWRSVNGNDFIPVGKVKSVGTSSNINYYYYSDNPGKKNGNIYYRLRQLDFDGKENFSNVISVTLFSYTSVDALPNPFMTELVLEYHSDANETIEILMFNARGNIVYKSHVLVNNGFNKITIPTEKFRKDIYNLKLISGGNSIHKKVVKL